MTNRLRERKYRYWTVNNAGLYQLHFTLLNQFDKDEIIVNLAKSETDENVYWYTSEFPEVTYNVIRAISDEEAMEKMENKIANKLKELYLYHKELNNKFTT